MKNILKKIHAVMKDVSYIQKDARNQHHNYNYASEKVIKAALHEAFVAHGIVFQLETSEYVTCPDPKASLLTCQYTFYDVDSGEKMEGKFIASGPARDDKGLWAATTNAIKYILTSTFLIPTGDDAESNENHPGDGAAKPAAAPTAKPAPPKIDHRESFRRAMREKANGEGTNLDDFSNDAKTIIIKGLVSFLAKGASPLRETPYSHEMAPTDDGWAELEKALCDPLGKWNLTDKCNEILDTEREAVK